MREIPLTRGKVALVDDADYEWLSQWKWHPLKKQAKNGLVRWYAIRHIQLNGKRTTRSMQIELGLTMGISPVDHRDCDGLNNQRSNLRQCTPTQSNANRRKQPFCLCPFKGVAWDKSTSKWLARVSFERTRHRIGLFDTQIEAALAYDVAAVNYFGEFAKTNAELGLL